MRVIIQWNRELSSSLASVKGSLNEIKQYRDPLSTQECCRSEICFYTKIRDFSHG